MATHASAIQTWMVSSCKAVATCRTSGACACAAFVSGCCFAFRSSAFSSSVVSTTVMSRQPALTCLPIRWMQHLPMELQQCRQPRARVTRLRPRNCTAHLRLPSTHRQPLPAQMCRHDLSRRHRRQPRHDHHHQSRCSRRRHRSLACHRHPRHQRPCWASSRSSTRDGLRDAHQTTLRALASSCAYSMDRRRQESRGCQMLARRLATTLRSP